MDWSRECVKLQNMSETTDFFFFPLFLKNYLYNLLICHTHLPDLFRRVNVTFNINNSVPPNLEEEPEQGQKAEDNEVEPALTSIHIYGSNR